MYRFGVKSERRKIGFHKGNKDSRQLGLRKQWQSNSRLMLAFSITKYIVKIKARFSKIHKLA